MPQVDPLKELKCLEKNGTVGQCTWTKDILQQLKCIRMDHTCWCHQEVQPAMGTTAVTYKYINLTTDIDKVTLTNLKAHVDFIKDSLKDTIGALTSLIHTIQNEQEAGQFILNSLRPEL